MLSRPGMGEYYEDEGKYSWIVYTVCVLVVGGLVGYVLSIAGTGLGAGMPAQAAAQTTAGRAAGGRKRAAGLPGHPDARSAESAGGGQRGEPAVRRAALRRRGPVLPACVRAQPLGRQRQHRSRDRALVHGPARRGAGAIRTVAADRADPRGDALQRRHRARRRQARLSGRRGGLGEAAGHVARLPRTLRACASGWPMRG